MFEVKIDIETAQKDVSKLLDIKKLLPSKREGLKGPIDQIVEAVSLGLVSIATDGTITQMLIEPVGDMVDLTYKPRHDAVTVSRKVSEIKSGSNQSVLLLMYAQLATGRLSAELARLGESDRDIRDSISSLFL